MNTKRKDNRAFERFTVRLMVKLSTPQSQRVDTAVAHDISARGAGLLYRKELDQSSPLELWVYSAKGGIPFHIKGEVAWSKPVDYNTWRLGINFERADFMGVSKILGLHD